MNRHLQSFSETLQGSKKDDAVSINLFYSHADFGKSTLQYMNQLTFLFSFIFLFLKQGAKSHFLLYFSYSVFSEAIFISIQEAGIFL